MINTPFPIILASQSPRRQQFLRQLGVSFSVSVANIDERRHPGEAPHDLVSRLSDEKAAVVAKKHPQALVIAADTIVVLGDAVLGKPEDAAHAREILRQLRNRQHFVFSSVTLMRAETGQKYAALNSTTIRMRNYTDAEIEAYIATGDPQDKAGADAIQHREFAPVACWEGCYAGVMGFPLYDVSLGLAQFGVDVPDVAAVCAAATGVSCCAVL